MRGTGPWVRGMDTWHHLFLTGLPIYFKGNGPGPVHGTMPLNPWTEWPSSPTITKIPPDPSQRAMRPCPTRHPPRQSVTHTMDRVNARFSLPDCCKPTCDETSWGTALGLFSTTSPSCTIVEDSPKPSSTASPHLMLEGPPPSQSHHPPLHYHA